jgi:DnaD/phage-associated family protein
MTKIEALERLEGAGLTPAHYRTARRILDRVHDDNGYVRLDYARARAICETESDETVRGHLARLSAADLITVRRNAAIHIHWHGWDGEDTQPALIDAETEPVNSRGIRVNSARNPREIRAAQPDTEEGEPVNSRGIRVKSARNSREIRAAQPDTEVEKADPVYIVTTTNVVVDNNNNNNNNSLSSSSSFGQAVTMEAAATIDPAAWAQVRATYEGNFGLFTSLLVDRVKATMRQYPAEMVVLAMDKAIGAEKRRWDYVEGILRNWAAEGYGSNAAGTSSKAAMGNTAKGRGAGRSVDAAVGGSVGRDARQAEADAEPTWLDEHYRASGWYEQRATARVGIDRTREWPEE